MISVTGLILAAGKSQRMGRSKLLLEYQGKTFLEHLCEEARGSLLTDLRIVVGYQAEEVQARFPGLSGCWVVNSRHEEGQFSSIQCGLNALKESFPDGVMLLLIDHPFVDRHLINLLLESFAGDPNQIVLPTYGERRGHPVIFPKSLYAELLAAPLERGASAVVRRHENKILRVPVGNPEVLIDIDTPEDYARYVARAEAKKDDGGRP
ncbi:MAG: nucleotidyltransferase family protein [Terriglobia bacterium]